MPDIQSNMSIILHKSTNMSIIVFVVFAMAFTLVQANTLSSQGLQCIESFEGFCPYCYQDTKNIWTIGYGHAFGKGTSSMTACCKVEPKLGDGTTLLNSDISVFVNCVNNIKATLTDGQFCSSCKCCIQLRLCRICKNCAV